MIYYITETQIPRGSTASNGGTFVQVDNGPVSGWSAIVKEVRQIVDNTAVIKSKRERLLEIRSSPLRTLEEIDGDLQRKAAEVTDAWKNQPAFSLPNALDQIRRNLRR
jgi:hypothetical protein